MSDKHRSQNQQQQSHKESTNTQPNLSTGTFDTKQDECGGGDEFDETVNTGSEERGGCTGKADGLEDGGSVVAVSGCERVSANKRQVVLFLFGTHLIEF